MIHPKTELRFVDDAIGWGVFATEFIPKGTIVWVLDALDQSFTRKEFAAFPAPYRPVVEKYCYLDGRGMWVLCWDHARMVNHSCEPALLPSGWLDFEVAVRDLKPGDAITDDYGTLNVDEDFECRCGSPHCRKKIRADDIDRFSDHWDALVQPAIRALPMVEQPLAAFWSSRDLVTRTLAANGPIPSIRANRFRG